MEVDKQGNAIVKMASGYTLRFEDDPEFEPVYRELAENELRETPERRAEALAELRRLIRGKRQIQYNPAIVRDEFIRINTEKKKKFAFSYVSLNTTTVKVDRVRILAI